jgi:L-histidine Nalpha-methyltransferase
LFDAITALPEYYPTRIEAEIFRRQGAAIAAELAGSDVLVDLGAGNCSKADYLLGPLQPQRYVAIDISTSHLRSSLWALQQRHPDVEMIGVGTDFTHSLELPGGTHLARAVFFYAGSSIGNWAPEQARRWLSGLRQHRGARLVVGVDLVKPIGILEAAYDDPLGVTAAFNRNLLRNLNRLLSANFDLRRIEMHLESATTQRVCWRGGEREFVAGERIHTENSYKYTIEGFETLLREAGFGGVRCFTDPGRWFGVFTAHA